MGRTYRRDKNSSKKKTKNPPDNIREKRKEKETLRNQSFEFEEDLIWDELEDYLDPNRRT